MICEIREFVVLELSLKKLQGGNNRNYILLVGGVLRLCGAEFLRVNTTGSNCF